MNQHRFKSHLLGRCLEARHCNPLCLHPFICKMGLTRVTGWLRGRTKSLEHGFSVNSGLLLLPVLLFHLGPAPHFRPTVWWQTAHRQHLPTKSWLLSCKRTCPSVGAGCTFGKSWSTWRDASFMFLSTLTWCHWLSLKCAGDCTEISKGPFPTSNEKVTTAGAGNRRHEDCST